MKYNYSSKEWWEQLGTTHNGVFFLSSADLCDIRMTSNNSDYQRRREGTKKKKRYADDRSGDCEDCMRAPPSDHPSSSIERTIQKDVTTLILGGFLVFFFGN